MKKVFIDLSGQKFGRLTVLSRASDGNGKKGHHVRFLCQCECGKKRIVHSCVLKNGHTQSCGCLCLEKSRMGNEPGESGLKRLLRIYKSNAAKDNRSFELTFEEFKKLTSKNCFYCGAEPEKICQTYGRNQMDKYSHYKYNGIDRVDTDQGYTIENTVSSCFPCNKMKGAYTQEFFINHVMKIATYQRS